MKYLRILFLSFALLTGAIMAPVVAAEEPITTVLDPVDASGSSAAVSIAVEDGDPGPTLVARFDSAGDSGVHGSATLEEWHVGHAEALLRLALEGLQPGESYAMHVHAGTPDAPSASFGDLGVVTADELGKARFSATAMMASAQGVPVELSFELLADGAHFIELLAADGTVVATAQVPQVQPGGAGDSPIESAKLALVLEPSEDSAVGGTLTVTLPAGRGQPGPAYLTLEAAGLQPGLPYTARLYAGTVDQPSASFGLLGAVEADADGYLLLELTEVATAGTSAIEPLSADLLLDGAHFVALYDVEGAGVASASLPRMEPTAIPAVDAALAAVQRGDVLGLLGLTHLSDLPCGPLTPEGFALVPECLEGEASGTLVPVLPAAACEPYWARDPRPVLQTFVEHAGVPYAVVRGPETQREDSLWPAAEYLVVFTPREGSFIDGLALYMAEGHIVAVQAGCNTPGRLVEHDDQPLPVIWRPAAPDASVQHGEGEGQP